ncbi:MAG: uroporphyrinogen-III C-methyltransferase [Chloroflexi bacterium]|nr:uroporphyrinogen-III C-methyltransferase [Chloroflexota bacterium]
MSVDEPRTVFIVGAGPGDPRLITLAGVEALQAADVVLHDRLISPALLKLAENAELLDVGKTPGAPAISQAQINTLMIEHSRSGRRVVRLKGGDPFVFGRGGEEASALAAAGIPMQIVPGVSSAFAAAASVGIAVTDRRAASAVTIITGSEGDGAAPPIDWGAVASVGGTIVVMMGWRNFDEIVQRLTEAGLPPTTPAAAIEQAWTGSQRAVFAPLDELSEQAGGMAAPVTVVIGETTQLATPEVSWTVPGRRILVTRARAQMPPLVERLRAFNAEVIELPTIEISPVDAAPIDATVGRLAAGAFDIICLTSVNGVQALWGALRRNELDARVFSAAQVAAIGSETAGALEERGITPDLIPERFTSEALADELTRSDLEGRRVLLARAARGSPLLAERLRKAGAEVEDLALYDVVTPSADREALRELERGVDVATLTSPSTADGLAKLVRGRVDVDSLHAVCIGPVTAEAAARLGFPVVGVAQRHTISGLAEAVGRYLSSLPPAEAESADSA